MKRYTIYIGEPEIIEHVEAQDNVSEYLRELVKADMGEDSAPSENVLTDILAELRLMRQDMAGLSVVKAEKPQEAARRGAPAGLARQASRFREGKRDV